MTNTIGRIRVETPHGSTILTLEVERPHGQPVVSIYHGNGEGDGNFRLDAEGVEDFIGLLESALRVFNSAPTLRVGRGEEEEE